MRLSIMLTAVTPLLVLAGCGDTAGPDASLDVGPTSYDSSGTMPCSAGAPTYDEACGWRVLRGGTIAAELWISNIAISDRPAYRVLEFSDGTFTARDGSALDVSLDGDTWSIGVEGREYYRFADAVITGG